MDLSVRNVMNHIRRNMAQNNKKHRTRRAHNEYKGPFHPNKNLEFDSVRKNMKTTTDGPTADMRSYNDSTISLSAKDDQYRNRKRPKPWNKKAKNWISEHWPGALVGVIVTAIASGIGIVVFNHGNQIVSINKDIEYMKDYNIESKNDINELEKSVIENTMDIKLIQQKLESFKDSQNKSNK